MSPSQRLHLFQGFGVELEYMIVDRTTLDVRPIADELLKAATGDYTSDFDREHISWSNELVNHVIELKTNGPAPSLVGLEAHFQQNVRDINAMLEPMGAMLLPTAMHPWMNPATETRLWPHEYSAVYQAYDRIFNAKGHGWSNVQSTHINLPFANDEEFGRLHAAIRLVLPILPALCASSPVVEGRATGHVDTRLRFYEKNQARVPSIAGLVIPERVYTEADYNEQIFQRTYRDIAPLDTDNVLQREFLNSRGAIARFSRGAIEIRVMDIQECPAADLAIVRAVAAALQRLVNEELAIFAVQREVDERLLKQVFDRAVSEGLDARLREEERLYADAVGFTPVPTSTLRDLWQHLLDGTGTAPVHILDPGGDNLARRTLRSVGVTATPPGTESPLAKDALAATYRRLADCLAEGTFFNP